MSHLRVALPSDKYQESGLDLGAKEAVVQSNLWSSTFLSKTTAVVRCFPSAAHGVSTARAVRQVCQRVADAGFLRIAHPRQRLGPF